MPKIITLPQHIIAKTAAGEVVERPASVVKELVENAIDAQATQVKVFIEDAGLKKIEVVDNGEGMDAFDLQECFKPHTTSKIKCEDDLNQIKTLGFRGEALPSIASVSKFTIKSKTAQEEVGNVIEVVNGEVVNFYQTGMPTGTLVTVENLFHNVPGRKNFLKSKRTELRHIIETLTSYALAFPHIGFYLSHNSKVILDLPAGQNLSERVAVIAGKTFSLHLLAVSHNGNYFNTKGFLGKPQLANQARNNQYIFVNQRAVRNALISKAVKDAYGNLLEARSYPVFILFFELPHEMVNVNIHPRKEEVNFSNDELVYEFMYDAVKQSLAKNDLSYIDTDIFGNDVYASFSHLRSKNDVLHGQNRKMSFYIADSLKDTVDTWQPNITEKSGEILQIADLYLITQTPKGLQIIDQHAAHERILYEQFLKAWENSSEKNKVAFLDTPLTFDLTYSQAEKLKENLSTLNQMGFEIEEFGGNSFKIFSVPYILKDKDVLEIVNAVSDALEEAGPGRAVEKTISYLACRSAIKGGDKLNMEERKNLLKKLSETKSNYTCPHGRPVKIEITFNELERMFKRR